jgi:redox-sensitive bicupin YhaK (pirin superfamily)
MTPVSPLPAILSAQPLGFPWVTLDPFLFCAYHDDAYPPGAEHMGPAVSLAGRQLGSDFSRQDGWSMYHGHPVPGFPAHPHRGFETVTIVRRGLIDHADSLGAAARFGRGDVQWLTAGRGIVHAEMFPLLATDQANPLELFQIWLNLPAASKMAPPHFTMIWSQDVVRHVTQDEAGHRTELAVIAGRLQDADAVATGVQVRLQLSLLRFLPNAEDQLKWLYEFVYNNRDLWVAVNMVGREDNDKGHPLRFLATLRELRHKYHSVKLSIHAGEVDEPNAHVRDTLLLGADRIGHGVNLITDADTMRLMRHGPYLVEINLISNLLLQYVSDYSQHPFPEYLRTGIPVALSTDDRGMWDSNMSDEFFVAVKEFNLSWPELVKLSRNSLAYSFAPEPVKQQLLATFASNITAFEQAVLATPASAQVEDAVSYGFVCKRYQLCRW